MISAKRERLLLNYTLFGYFLRVIALYLDISMSVVGGRLVYGDVPKHRATDNLAEFRERVNSSYNPPVVVRCLLHKCGYSLLVGCFVLIFGSASRESCLGCCSLNLSLL